MSAHTEWLAAANTEIGGSARPDYIIGSSGEGNSVACITVTDVYTGDGLVLQGRPEQLLEKAREILRAAEQIVEVTMREPELRSLYGITSQPGTDGGS